MEPPTPSGQPPNPVPGSAVDSPPPRVRLAELALILCLVALIASVPILQAAVELRRGEGVRALDVFRQKPTAAGLRAFEHQLEDGSVAARAFRPWFQFAQFAWLGDGGAKALVGRDGWLFYKPGCDDMLARPGSSANATHDPVVAIVQFRDALAARGIRLLVVPAPNKESIYPDQLTRRFAGPGGVMAPTTRDLLTRLQAANVECLDLFALFAEARTHPNAGRAPPLYLVQDSHWSPAGMALAAQAVAGRLVQLGWVSPGTVDYQTKPAPVERLGDVLRMLQSATLERVTAPECVPCVQVIRTDTGERYQDEAEAGVLVLGDSFLRIFQQDEPGAAGFVAHLAKDLGQPIASLVNDGGASTLVRQELYRRPALLKHTRVVVWEFVERDLRLGTEGWQPVPLPALASRNPEGEAPPDPDPGRAGDLASVASLGSAGGRPAAMSTPAVSWSRRPLHVPGRFPASMTPTD